MQIDYLNPEGVNEAEKSALLRINKCLPDSWKGFASLEMIDRVQGNGEIDLVLITDYHVIVVELKSLHGELTSNGNYWFKNKRRLYRSPIKVTDLKRKKLASKIKSKLESRLPRIPFVDFCVVIYGDVSKDNLQDDERGFVHTLDEFCAIGKTKNYEKAFSLKQWEKKLPKDKRPNSSLRIWNQFFGKNTVDFKGQEYSVNNYTVSGNALFKHREGIYQEFQSQRRDDSNYKALMRIWNFSAPAIIERAQTPEERRLISYRESKVLGYIDNQNDDLKELHLRLIYVPSPEELTVDFCELYEWPNNRLRLDDFVNKNNKRLSPEKRLGIIQILIAQIARLHEIDVAHRDIGKHSIWLALPSKVTLSNFLAASYPDPENRTVHSVRDVLQASRIQIPEDLYEDSDGTPYTRDVYLTGAAAHYIAYGVWPEKQDDVYCWVEKDGDPYEGRFDSWFSRTLHIEARQRYRNMREALDEFNEIYESEAVNHADHADEINRFLSDVNVYLEYQPSLVSSKGSSMLMRSGEGQYGVKITNGVSQLNSDKTVNHHLLVFLHRVQALSNSRLPCLAPIHQLGFNPSMQCLFVVYVWQEGPTWKNWIQGDLSLGEVIRALYSLLSAVAEIHRFHLSHGDLHPENIILVKGVDGWSPVFIDFFDYSDRSLSPYNPAYVPDNYEHLGVGSRDRYAVIKILVETAEHLEVSNLETYGRGMLDQPEISEGDLARLLEEFENIVNPKPIGKIDQYVVSGDRIRMTGMEKIQSDDGYYYLSLREGKDRETNKQIMKVYISGVQKQLDIHIDPNSAVAERVFIRDITHTQFMRNKRLANIELEAEINIQRGVANDAGPFIKWLLGQPKTQDLLQKGERLEAQDYLGVLGGQSITDIPAANFWQVIVETEEETFPTVIAERDSDDLPNSDLLVHYSAEVANLDFDLATDTVIVKKETSNGYRVIGRLSEYTKSLCRITSVRGWATINAGDTIRLESTLTAASLAKRQKAVDSLVMGRAVIPNLPSYFDYQSDLLPVSVVAEPTDDELDYYSESDAEGNVKFTLNETQRRAFKKLYSNGPVGLLQGPPGTGKTAFIGSFIHYAIEKGAQHILLVSQSHEAVNNAVEKVRGLFSRREVDIGVVRLGNEGSVSESLLDVHELALQEQYREKFRAEYKTRLKKVSEPLCLPEEFIDGCINFEASIGMVLDSMIGMSHLSETDDDARGMLHGRIRRFRDKLSRITSQECGLSNNISSLELGEIRDEFYAEMAEHCDVDTPDAIVRFRQLVALTSEWLTVMSSRNARFQNFLVKTRALVSGTCVGVGRTHYGIEENVYDWVIIDEAARSSASEMAIAMQVGRRILLVGDHMQLPPLYDEDHLKAAQRKLPSVSTKELARSDFERAFVSSYGKKIGQTLLVQYRMAPAIGALVSYCFYKELLETGRGDPGDYVKSLPKKLGTTVTWIDTACAGSDAYESRASGRVESRHSRVNEYEARLVMALVQAITQSDEFLESALGQEDKEPPIGVICMYGEQKRLLIRKFNSTAWAGNLLEKRVVKIDTVDSYQGKENQVIILSLVRNNPKLSEGFLSSEQRINVAVSRAKERLYIVGSTNMWTEKNNKSSVGRILSYIREHLGEQYALIDSEIITKGGA